MKKEAGHENQPDGQEVRAEVQGVRNLLYKRQKEQSNKDLSKKVAPDEQAEVQLKTKCTKRSRNTLLGVESYVERIQK